MLLTIRIFANLLDIIHKCRHSQARLQRTARDRPFMFFYKRYNRVILCTKMTNLTQKRVRYNRVFDNNRDRLTEFVITEFHFTRKCKHTLIKISPSHDIT